jgi:hypothetical protein
VESKWKNYHITTFLDSLSPKSLSLEEAVDLSRDRNEMNDVKQGYQINNGSVNTFPWQPRIAGGVLFYAVLVVSKESRLLVFPTTSCFYILMEIFLRNPYFHFAEPRVPRNTIWETPV